MQENAILDNTIPTLKGVIKAYACGFFPMAKNQHDAALLWVKPEKRAIIPLNGFHISRSLRRTLRKNPYAIAINTDFEQTIYKCAQRKNTWINNTIIHLFTKLHKRGLAHSIEVWDQGHLIGGVYGMELGAAFFGESMFSEQTNASKIALSYLVARLQFGNYTLFDVQFQNNHLRTLGAVEIDDSIYTKRLHHALLRKGDFYAYPADSVGDAVIQCNNQMS